jgi:hypothetical protein
VLLEVAVDLLHRPLNPVNHEPGVVDEVGVDEERYGLLNLLLRPLTDYGLDLQLRLLLAPVDLV